MQHNSYNLFPSDVEYYISCYPELNQMIDCHDKRIDIASNYWMGITENSQIISSICPNKQCCQASNECDFISNKELLCASGRDYQSILCSECKDGYTEAMNNASVSNVMRKFILNICCIQY